MNCRRIEKLIPLYVEGDLDTGQADQVRAHAKSCPNCNGLVAEYKESQRWLRSFAPPHFDDALLDDLKLGVLEKINEQEEPVSFLNAIAGQWTRRLVLAASVALLIAFGVLAFYVYQNNRNDIVAESGTEQGEQSREIALQLEAVKQAPRASFSIKHRRHMANAQRRLGAARRHANSEQVAERLDEPGARHDVATETSAGLSDDPAASQEMLRIEIQTSDPSIRIIWFSPKENNSNPSKPITETE